MVAWSQQPGAETQWEPASSWHPEIPSPPNRLVGRSPAVPGMRSSHMGWEGWTHRKMPCVWVSECKWYLGKDLHSTHTGLRSSLQAYLVSPIPHYVSSQPSQLCPFHSGGSADCHCMSKSHKSSGIAGHQRGRRRRPLCTSFWWLQGNPTWSDHHVESPH